MDYDAYDAQAGTINIDDITSDEINRDILHRLKVNCEELTEMWVCGEGDRDDNFDYCPTNAHDLGWLGYFIGQNTRLQHFQMMGYLNYVDPNVQPFLRGLWCNRHIEKMTFSCYDLRGGDVFSTLAPFFKNNRSLSKVAISNCTFDDDSCRFLSLALGGCNLLKQFELVGCGITDSQSLNIIEALSRHTQLESIALHCNNIGRSGCVALARAFQWETADLNKLVLCQNSIDDEGMEALMPALAKNSNLRELNLAGNTSITIKGFGALSSVLVSPTSNLNELSVERNNICDEVLKMLARALVNNNTLKWLQLNRNDITGEGWLALSQILCNTSSINATYLSNHTLVGVGGPTNDNDLNSLLALNGSSYPKMKIAMMKILKHHNNFDMQPLFEWDFKFLPYMIEWFEMAAECPSRYGAFQLPHRRIQQRKLSAIYQFICGMPLEFIEARSAQQLKEIAATKKRLRNELEEAEHLECRISRSRASR